MQKHFRIVSPCNEDWSKMTPEQQGRHCSACSTTVTDFTNMSDEELVDALTSGKYKCCRVYPEQLKTYDISASRKRYWNTVAASLIAGLLTITSIQAQKSYVVQKENKKGEKGNITTRIENNVQLRIIDAKTKEPLPYIRLYNSVMQKTFITDSTGLVTIEINASGSTQSTLELIATRTKPKGTYMIKYQATLQIDLDAIRTLPMVVELGGFKRTGKYTVRKSMGCPSF